MYFSKGKCGFFKIPPFTDHIDFGLDFGANLPPCWPLKSKIFRFLEVPRGLQNFIVFGYRFFIDFGSILASNMGPSWGPRRLKIQKLGPNQSLRSPPLLVLNTFFLQNLVFDRFGLDFGGVRGRFLEDFWMIFGGFLAYFGHAFGCSCWGAHQPINDMTSPKANKGTYQKISFLFLGPLWREL